MDHGRLQYLFDRHVSGLLTASEELEFAAYVIDPVFKSTLSELEAAYWEQLKDCEDPLPEKAIHSLQSILPAKKTPLWRPMYLRIAAAVILLFIAAGLYRFFIAESPEKIIPPPAALTGDVQAPASNRARIVLANGHTVYLDSTANGALAVQGNIQLMKLANGQIEYKALDKQTLSSPLYNTLTNPRGSRIIDMALEDGSHVWLNAGSSITFPVRFTGRERQVSITGEAYFEVAHKPSQPFYVAKGDLKVQVLGTRFNVNAYDDESDIRITLLEGSVQVIRQQEHLQITPNQQVIAPQGGFMTVNKQVDVEEVMAWKNGHFMFEGTGIHSAMRQIGRWYDVEIIYESDHPEMHLRGEISRDADASKVLKMLESTGVVRFRIEGKKIFVVNP